ncbi:glycosyltransferase family 2 protein [Halomonas saccharevitans]|uniref:Glycosyltransferase involved in cell wall bisynthesis n=1 Tax=Halomonas saccharevitans TaxID=416872 RepID=A0A1I7CK56_9GAMM|nr:glycosyltransferase family 2 protein [Halomonas saccharevitans]SFT99825.1 Glycosyltransferase involved in cell wall bisynthesis [Halomonas saccharevitans]
MSPSLPAVSIGIPFFNAEDTLLDAVRSVFAQTHVNWELILLDDGSTDKSLELAKSIKDPRVTVYSDGQNRRLAARLNQMAKLASHDYMARMDADDLISPDRLRLQLEFLQVRPAVDLVSTGVCSLSNANEPLGIRVPPECHDVSPRSLLLANSGIVHASLLGKRSWFLRNRYREQISTGQDANLWVRAFSNDDLNVGFINKPLYYYREDGNVTSLKIKNAYREILRTILRESGHGFSTPDKTFAYLIILAKFMIAQSLSTFGSLDLLRKRRNRTLLSQDDKDFFISEIRNIQSTKIPQ